MDNFFYQTSEFLNKEQNFLSINNLVKISGDKGFLIDKIPYASNNNFCQKQLYSHNFIYLHVDAFEKLIMAQQYAIQENFKIKLFDGYRPYEIQAFMADQFPHHVENGYVSQPKDGVATHVRGIAIDLTLCNSAGVELDMGSSFDEMSKKSFHNYKEFSLTIIKNRQMLLNIMVKAGFQFYPYEWWHYNLPIFKYDLKNNFIGTLDEAEKKYPKITNCFIDLISDEVKNFII